MSPWKAWQEAARQQHRRHLQRERARTAHGVGLPRGLQQEIPTSARHINRHEVGMLKGVPAKVSEKLAVPRVVIVEDHPATREELVRSFESHRARINITAVFANAEELFSRAALDKVDLALVDLGLPNLSGSEVIRMLGESHPRIRAIALTAFADERSVFEALNSGAYGYLLKDEPIERLVAAMEEAAAGEHPVSSRIAGFLIARVRECKTITLTDRERELAQELSKGLTYGECASSMGIGIGTVQDRVKSLYRKLNVHSREEVRQWVRQNLAPRLSR